MPNMTSYVYACVLYSENTETHMFIYFEMLFHDHVSDHSLDTWLRHVTDFPVNPGGCARASRGLRSRAAAPDDARLADAEDSGDDAFRAGRWTQDL